MNRVVMCMLAGALALSLSPAALAQDEAPAAESKPVPLAEADPADYVDLLAEGKGGDVLGVVFDVILDDSGKATTIVLELFPEEPAEAAPAEGEGELAAQDTKEEEPEPLPAEEEGADEAAAEGELAEEPMMVGKLVGISAKGATLNKGSGLVTVPSVTAADVQKMDEFVYEPGMKTAGYPEGYPAEEEAADEEEEEGEE